MGVKDEAMTDSSIETHLQQDIFPQVLIEQKSVEFVEGAVDRNRQALWETLKPSLDVLIDKFELPRKKPEEMTDVQYFEFLVDKMYGQNMTVRRLDREQVKWSVWPSVANETGATNCSLGAQVFLELLDTAGYDVEYGMPGPLTHSIAFAKSGEDYYYIDPTNGIVEKVAETIEVDGIKVHVLKTDNFKCPFEAVPAFPSEYSVVATVSNLQALQSEHDRPNPSEFVATLETRFGLVENQHYLEWVKQNLFPEWDKLTTDEFWKEETARVDKKLSYDLPTT